MAQNIEMQCKQSDGSYETLLPKTQSSLITLNNTDLGNHLGGNTTVEGSLDYLSRIYAYWWKRDIITPVYKFTETAVTEQYYNKGNYLVQTINYPYQVSYSKSGYKNQAYNTGIVVYKQASINSSGQIVLSNVTSSLVGYPEGNSDDSRYTTWRWSSVPWDGINYVYVKTSNGYFKTTALGCMSDTYDDKKYYCHLEGNTSQQTFSWKLNVVVDHNDYVTDYVYSFSRDAYPDSGTVGNYTYTYLGIPFENAMKDGPK